MTYSEKLRDPRWQRKRLEFFNRDKFTCRKCNSEKVSLTVHHLCYLPGINPWEHPNDLLLTLCETCHKAEGEMSPFGKLEKLSVAVLFALRQKTEEKLSKRYSKRTSRFLDCIIYLLEHTHAK